jgi:hypothetical protein
MSSCTRVARSQAPSSLVTPSQEDHEGVPLIFDVCVLGFYKWSRGRLRLLGYDPIPTPYKYDDQIVTFAKTIGGIIVTTDKGFSKFEKSIILKQDKYEKMYTQLVKQLRKMKTDFWLSSLARGAPP